MKNLKRILSLALAGTMLVGMMVVGASAADFTDADKIEHTEAVETLSALGIINGFKQPDGTVEFSPEGTLTRAQMATMLATILNKGTLPTWAVKEKPTFDDVAKGFWAEAAIEYCYNLGVVNGYSATSFGPNDELTATQAARMILNAMGYKIEGGSDWALQTEIQARDENLDLYKGLDEVVTNEAISRDNVAQMLNTALNKPVAGAENTTTYVYELIKNDGSVNMGTFESATEAASFAQGNNLAAGAYTITRTPATSTESLGNKYLGLKSPTIPVSAVTYSNGKYTVGDYTTTIDLSQYMGQKVKVLYKDNAAKTVYGVIPQGSVAFTGTYADLDASGLTASNKKIKLAGVEFKANNESLTTSGWNGATVASPNPWDELIAVDADNDGDVDALLVKPVVVSQVSTVSRDGKNITIASVNTNEEGTAQALEIAKNDVAEGLEATDWVVSTKDVKNVWTVKKAEIVKNVRYTKLNANGTFLIGGVSYDEGTDSVMAGKTVGAQPYDLVVYGGYIFAIDNAAGEGPAAVNLADVVYVLALQNVEEGTTKAVKDANSMGGDVTYSLNVQVLKQDNTKTIVNVKSVGGAPMEETHGLTADTLYVMTTDEDGVIDLTKVEGTGESTKVWNGLTETTVATDANIKSGMLGTTRIAENAVLFVKIAGKVECLDGKTVAGWTMEAGEGNNFAANSYSYTKEDTKTGYEYVNMGILLCDDAVTSRPDAVSEESVGFITGSAELQYLSKGEKNVAADGKYYTLTIWDGETEKEYVSKKDADLSDAAFAAGNFVTFHMEGNSIVATTLTATKDAIKAFDGNDYTTVNGVSGKASKTVVIYIDDAKNAKADEGAIRRADKDVETDALINNVYTASLEDGTKILFVDVNNKVDADAEDDADDTEGENPGTENPPSGEDPDDEDNEGE